MPSPSNWPFLRNLGIATGVVVALGSVFASGVAYSGRDYELAALTLRVSALEVQVDAATVALGDRLDVRDDDLGDKIDDLTCLVLDLHKQRKPGCPLSYITTTE